MKKNKLVLISHLLILFFLTNCQNEDNVDDSNSVIINGNKVVSWAEAVKIIKNGGDNKSYTVTIDSDIAVSPANLYSTTFGTVNNLEVILEGNGRFYLIKRGTLFWLGESHDDQLNKHEASQKLILNGQITFEGMRKGGNGNQDNNESIIYVGKGGTLEMRSGIITGNTINSDFSSGYDASAAVTVNSDGTFIMSGAIYVEMSATNMVVVQ